MNILYKNIESLCQEKGVSIGKMCAEAKISRGLLSDLKTGRKKTFTVPTAKKMADYFGVSVDYITGEDTKKEAAPISGSGLPEGYVQLTPENRAIVDRLIADLAKSQSKT